MAPHYGANVKLDGPGNYHLTYRISPPAYQGFYRHFDKETGLGQWRPPFRLHWDFTYVGTGKKGGYQRHRLLLGYSLAGFRECRVLLARRNAL